MMEKTKKVLSANMKKIREVQKLSQLSLAEAANLSVQMVRDIEAGRRWPSASTLEAISKALDVRVSDLFQEYGKGNLTAADLKRALKVINEIHGYDLTKLKT